MKLRPFHLFQALVMTAVVGTVIAGFVVVGSPSLERSRRLDQQRVNDLQQLSGAIESYYNLNNRYTLPESLLQLVRQPNSYVNSIVDPKTGEQYTYRAVSATEYELCANFETNVPVNPQGQIPAAPYQVYPVKQPGVDLTRHQAGKLCLTQEVQKWPKP